MKELTQETCLTNDLTLRERICEMGERHEVIRGQEVVAHASIDRYESAQDFLALFWHPIIVGMECEWLSNEVMEGVAFEDLMQWNEATLLEYIREDEELMYEAELLIPALRFEESIKQYPHLKGVGIVSITSFETGKGFGTQLVNHYKNTVNFIVLNSTSHAMSYWEKQGFVEFYNGYYVWSKHLDVLTLFTEGWLNTDQFESEEQGTGAKKMNTLTAQLEIPRADYEEITQRVVDHLEEIESGDGECSETFYYLDEFSTTFEDGYGFRLLFFADVEHSIISVDSILSTPDEEEVDESQSYTIEVPDYERDGLGTFVLEHEGREYQVEILIK